jgi:ElaB/YqjD/DUF883 family membrane-anchored ribosome-binding protein
MTTSSYKTVRNDIKSLMRDAQELFREATSTTGDRAEELRTKGLDMLDNAVDRAQDMQAVAFETGKEFAEQADSFVKQNPWQAVAISAGIGLLVGMLLSARK